MKKETETLKNETITRINKKSKQWVQQRSRKRDGKSLEEKEEKFG